MRTGIFRAAFAAALLTVGAGCVRSYATSPALDFKDIPYTSPEGAQWPTQRMALPDTAAAYGMRSVPEVAYVELNPQGARTLIFVHGLGSYLKFWRYQLDLFAAKGYRVLAVDLPGFGKSDKPASFPYTMEAMADAVREFAAKANARRPVLVGHSMGGQTALSFAIRYPQDVEALVLTAPAGFEYFSRKEKAWFKKVFARELILEAPEYGIWGSIRQLNFARWRPDLEWLIEERVRLARNKDFDQYAYANVKSVDGLTRNDFVRLNLDKVRVPTLIVYGAWDRLIPNPYLHGGEARTVMTWGHQNITGSKLVELPRCGHSVQLDCPDEYNQAVLDFLTAPGGVVASKAEEK